MLSAHCETCEMGAPSGGLPIWEICPWDMGQRESWAHRAGGRGRASDATQDRSGQWGIAAGRPGQLCRPEGFATGQFLGAGHQVDRVARRTSGLTSDIDSPWHGRPYQHVPRPGVGVVSVGSYPANGLGNILGGPGRGRGAGPWQRGGAARPGAGVLEQDMETWEGDWTGLTATQER